MENKDVFNKKKITDYLPKPYKLLDLKLKPPKNGLQVFRQ
jgi:hypothetical protein